MSARAEQAPLRTHERQVATANRAEEHKSSVADGRPGTQWWRKVTVTGTGTGRIPSTLADSAEHCQGRAGALAHHGFEGNAWYVDNLAQFGTAEQTLRGVGHARGRAVERARGGGAHAGDCAVIALLALYLVTTDLSSAPRSKRCAALGMRAAARSNAPEEAVRMPEIAR